ncbi:acyltransferase family protein [Cypionkella sinensis]|uniref:Acyltransferase family protein n=1 Tax=Cypionkella sinensis TaxID=1756043 RepID=A0ABV7IUY8_9RHOB
MIASESQGRYRSLQILRAVAAWMVFYHHFMQMYYNFEFETVTGYFFATFGGFGVDLFFVLSGFVMYFSAKNPHQTARDFIADRILRITPAYWLYTIATIICIYLFPIEFQFTGANIASVLYSMFFIPHSNPSGIGVFPTLTVGWTLNYEMFFYAILALSLLISKKFALTICAAILLLLPAVYPKDIAFSEIASSHRLHAFLMGLIIASLISAGRRFGEMSCKSRIALVLITGSTATAIAFIAQDGSAKRTALAGLLVCLTLLTEPIARLRFFVIEFLIKLGDASYSTYLVHTLVIGIILHFSGAPSDQFSIWLTIAAISLCIYLVSNASYTWIERNKYLSRRKRPYNSRRHLTEKVL